MLGWLFIMVYFVVIGGLIFIFKRLAKKATEELKEVME